MLGEADNVKRLFRSERIHQVDEAVGAESSDLRTIGIRIAYNVAGYSIPTRDDVPARRKAVLYDASPFFLVSLPVAVVTSVINIARVHPWSGGLRHHEGKRDGAEGLLTWNEETDDTSFSLKR
jgi:hypothetical protein